jgi:hypothetical protein
MMSPRPLSALPAHPGRPALPPLLAGTGTGTGTAERHTRVSGNAPPLARATPPETTAAGAPGVLRPRRGSRSHHTHNAHRHHVAEQALVVPACTEVETVEVVTADDLCQYLARGPSLAPAGASRSGSGLPAFEESVAAECLSVGGGAGTPMPGPAGPGQVAASPTVEGSVASGPAVEATVSMGLPARLPVFHRQPGELPAGEDWQMLESPQRAALETRATVESIDVQGISHSVQATAYALDRCEAAHLVALAETTLAVIAAEDGPDTLEVLLRSHGTYSARELISQHLPRTVVRAVLVDTDLTKTQAHRRIVEAVLAYLGFSRCLALVLEGRLSMAKLRALLRVSTRLQLHDVRWLDRDTTGRVTADNGRNAEDVYAPPVHGQGQVEEEQAVSESVSPACVRDQHARLRGPALLAAPVETFTEHVRAQAALCAPPVSAVKTVHDGRRVSYERAASGRAFLTLEGPITVLEPYYQRLQATARAIRAGRFQALTTDTDTGAGAASSPVFGSVCAEGVLPEAVVVEERTLDQLMFDLAALAAPATYVPLDIHAPDCTRTATCAGTEAVRATTPAGGIGDCAGGGEGRAATVACADGRHSALASPSLQSSPEGSLPPVVEKRRIRLTNPAGGPPIETYAVVHVPLQGTRTRTGTITAADAPVIADSRRRRLPHPPAPASGETTPEPPHSHRPPPPAEGRSAPTPGPPADQPAEAAFPPLLRVQCPTEGEWLSQQATVMVTVPVLHLLTRETPAGGASTGNAPTGEVPAELTGLTPLPADVARQIVSTQSVLYRILTDPITGTVLDETAHTYTIPANVRRTVTAKHKQCAAPGCTRTALRCQADHILPFNHLLPAQGGLTVPGNLQPLCQPCHQLKTQGLLTVKKDTGGVSRWSGPLGRESVTLAPPSPYEVQAAVQLRNLLHEKAHDSGAADESTSTRQSSPSVGGNAAGTTTAAGAAADTGPVGITEQGPGDSGSAAAQTAMGGSGAESHRIDDTGAQSGSTRPAIWMQDEAPPF